MNRQYLFASGLVVVSILAILFAGKTEDLLSLLGGISATMIGVLLALELEKARNASVEKAEFESGLDALDLELEQSLSILRNHRTGISTKTFNYAAINASLIDLFLNRAFTIVYGGRVFRQALLICRTRIESYRAAYVRFETLVSQPTGLSAEHVQKVHDLVAQTEFTIVLLRSLITKYRDDPVSLLKDDVYERYAKALDREKQYRAENLSSAYEKLMVEIRL